MPKDPSRHYIHVQPYHFEEHEKTIESVKKAFHKINKRCEFVGMEVSNNKSEPNYLIFSTSVEHWK